MFSNSKKHTPLSPLTCRHKDTVRRHPDPMWRSAGYGKCEACDANVPTETTSK